MQSQIQKAAIECEHFKETDSGSNLPKAYQWKRVREGDPGSGVCLFSGRINNSHMRGMKSLP